MNQLERIFAVGTRTSEKWQNHPSNDLPSNHIECKDGFRMSVIAGYGTYSDPRPGDIWGTKPDTYEGPYTAVEVGYPTERPEPWARWKEYADDRGDPTDTLYGFVPIELVRDLAERHGGLA